MEDNENVQSNPETVDNSVFGSEDDFFSKLEDNVNGIVQDESDGQTQITSGQQNPGKESTTQVVSQNDEIDTLKKRYSDSSREAQNLKAQLNQLKPFVPVLDAMKKDGNLVNHVRDYFKNGGKVNDNVKEQLDLDDDFEFDPDDMVRNKDSDSRKVFEKMVGNLVDKKANEIVEGQRQESAKEQFKENTKQKAVAFMKNHGMTPQEFQAFTNEARQKIQKDGISFEDMYLITNQGKVNQNVANSTKNDMLNQMKNVRDIPTSVSSANSAGKSNSQNDNVFDALLNSEGNIEELLG